METTSSYREAIKKALLLFANLQANPPAITPDRVDAWEYVLKSAGILESELPLTTQKVLQTCRFFPTPADFIQAARPQPTRDDEDRVWSTVQRLLIGEHRLTAWDSVTVQDCDGDPHLLEAISRIGWELLHSTYDQDTAPSLRRRVVSEWRQAVQDNRRRWYFAGLSEVSNRSHGYALEGTHGHRSRLCDHWRERQAKEETALAEVGR